MAKNAPGKHYRNTIGTKAIGKMVADEQFVEEWFIETIWGDDVRCPKCDADRIRKIAKNKPARRFYCNACRRYFSVKTGTVMQDSNIELSDWLLAIYHMVTENKGESSLQLHRDVEVTQSTAWHLAHRIRAAFIPDDMPEKFNGPVEVDEAHIGGKSKMMSHSRRAKMKSLGLLGGGPRGKTHVVGMRDRETGMVRAEVVSNLQSSTIQKFVTDNTHEDTMIYTDESNAYNGLPRPHRRVSHKARNYVDGEATTNRIEALWSSLKRGIVGSYHNISPKHAQRYVDEFAGRHNMRPLDTIDQMRLVARNMVGKRLKYDDLTAWTGDNRYTVIVE